MPNSIYTKINGINRLDSFKAMLPPWDRSILKDFELVLTATELEIRGGTAKQQWSLFQARHRLQKIATSKLKVEIAMYGSIFSLNQNGRLGIFLSGSELE